MTLKFKEIQFSRLAPARRKQSGRPGIACRAVSVDHHANNNVNYSTKQVFLFSPISEFFLHSFAICANSNITFDCFEILKSLHKILHFLY